MNYNDILIKYIDKCPYDEPIFIEEIKDYFKKIVQDNFENTFKNIVEGCKDNFGEFKSATYEKAIRSGDYEVVLFNSDFTNKSNVKIMLSLNADGKISGVNFK